MIGKFYLLVTSFLLLSLVSSGQISKIKGAVQDSASGTPLHGATFEIFSGTNLLSKGLTDSSGLYLFSLKTKVRKLQIKISSVGYKTVASNIDFHKLDSDINGMLLMAVIKLTPSAILLNEVVITKQKRYRDTTIIDLSDKSFKRSIMIDDIFTQNGLSKGVDGQLYYKGKLVSSILLNGGDFFGKNNLKIYDKVPALILSRIEVFETSIDSVTNTTLLNPMIKINLKLKENYSKGKFGSASGGIGTERKKLYFSDLYAYKKQQQISLTTGIDNIGLYQNQGEPASNFSAPNNNTLKNFGNITYRNLYRGKLEMNILMKAYKQNGVLISEVEQNEPILKQYSRTKSSSNSKSFGIENLELNSHYKIDSLSLIRFENHLTSETNRNQDEISYYIENDSSKINAELNRLRSVGNTSLMSTMTYEKRFSMPGRLFETFITAQRVRYEISETGNTINQLEKKIIIGDRSIRDGNLTLQVNYTEPLNQDSYLKFNLSYRKWTVKAMSLTSMNSPELKFEDQNNLLSRFFQTGVTFYKVINNFSINTSINTIVNTRQIKSLSQKSDEFFNFDFDFRVNRRLSSRKALTLNYNITPHYPNLNQVTSLTSTFDLISQTTGNINLKPEIKQNLGFVYDHKISDSLTLYASTEANYYFNKFGNNLMTNLDAAQQIFTDNIGNAKSLQVDFLLSKTFLSVGNIAYRLGINYADLPSIINGVKNLSEGITFRQSVSTSKSMANGLLILQPSVSTTLTRYRYDGYLQKSFSISYSDKIALYYHNWEINTYPVITLIKMPYNRDLTWGINCEVRKKVFDDYGLIWIKAYDLFNSFQVNYNNFGPSYVQLIKQSNSRRFFLIGATIKFNNLK